jgi:hypothetical protein
MKYVAGILLLVGLTACSPSQDEHARSQAHQTAEQAKHDAREVLHDAKVETQKASQALDKDLHEARDKTRRALDVPPDNQRDKPRP